MSHYGKMAAITLAPDINAFFKEGRMNSKDLSVFGILHFRSERAVLANFHLISQKWLTYTPLKQSVE